MRLVTRGDLDGVTSAVLISTVENIDSVTLIHPQDITDMKFEITGNDIMANLPYDPRCAMWFDHHELTESNLRPPEGYPGKHAIAPSTARVIYDYYSSEKLKKYEYLVNETDRFDSARLTVSDVFQPEGVILVGFTIDSRSGIGEYRDYFMKLLDYLKTLPIEEVLEKPEVRERVSLLKENNSQFFELLKEHSHQEGNVVVTDFRSLEQIPVGNRFLVYAMFLDANVSVRIQWGPEKKFVAVTLGHNILKGNCRANCGEICSDFGGGGHKGAAACILHPESANERIKEIIERLKKYR